MTVPPPSLLAALDALFAPYNRIDAPGLVVGIAQRGATLYRRGFGMASLEHAVANTPATRMRIGSVTKHFTCLAVLLLAEDGRLDIDSGIRTYLPELPPRAVEPTLRQLMTHTGGERCFLDLAMLTQGLAMLPDGAPLAMQARQTDINFPAGERTLYSNGGYQMLSAVIERASGMPFEAFLTTRIFAPIHMTDTASVPNDLTIAPRVATLHVPDPAGGYQRGIFPLWRARGEGAVISTVDDMLGWLAHMRGEKRIGSAPTWRAMLTPAGVAGAHGTYALGLMRSPYRGVDCIHHAGGVIGGACQMLTVPSHGLDIVIITNGAPANPIELSHRVIDLVLNGELAPPETAAPAGLEGRESWPGKYHDAASGTFYEIVARHDALALVHFNFVPYPMPLVARPDGSLELEDGPEGPFHLKQLDHGERLAVTHCGRSSMLTRVPLAWPQPGDMLDGLSGEYVSDDAGAHAVIVADSEGIAMRVQGEYGAACYRLTPLAVDLLAFEPTDTRSMAYGAMRLTLEHGTVVQFRLDTWRTRHLRFVRTS